MAKAVSSEELQFKKRARRRLVGAIALVLAVVVFLPMILDNEPKPVSENISINIPPPPVATALPDGMQEPDAAQSEPLRFRPIEDSAKPVQEPAQRARPQASTAPEPVRAKPAPETKPAQTQSSGTSSKKGYVVQLGAFSDAANAKRLAKTVRDNRFEAYTEVVMTSGGKRTRVRVGPYPTRSEALSARDRLKARKLTYGEPDIVRQGE